MGVSFAEPSPFVEWKNTQLSSGLRAELGNGTRKACVPMAVVGSCVCVCESDILPKTNSKIP